MGAKDDTEKVLRDIHVLFSKAQPYQNSKVNVVINKEEAMELLKKLSLSMNDMMEEYEMTKASREKAARKQKKEADEKEALAKSRAEDVYAASIIYMDQTLSRIRDIISDANERMDALAEETKRSFDQETRKIKENQSELQGQLQDFIDTDKYLHLIEDENRRLAKEKESHEAEMAGDTAVPLSEVMSEIRVNPQFIPGYEGTAGYGDSAGAEGIDFDAIMSEEIEDAGSTLAAQDSSKPDEPVIRVQLPDPEKLKAAREREAQESKSPQNTVKSSAGKSSTESYGTDIPDFGEKKPNPEDAPEIKDYGFDWKELDGEDNHDETVDRVLSLFGKKKK